MGEYKKVQRMFLQTCAGRSCIPEEDALKAFKTISNTDEATADDMLKCIKTINKQLAPLSQQIVVTQCAITKRNFVVFSDTSEAAILKQQSNHTEHELIFFRDLLAALAMAPSYSLDTIAAINVTNQITGPKAITKNRAEQLIELWADQGYLLVIDEVLNFGPRCVIEFGSYLDKHYSDYVIKCMLCKVMVLKPIVCADCSQRFHENCIRTYLKKTSNCAKCKKPWSVRMSM